MTSFETEAQRKTAIENEEAPRDKPQRWATSKDAASVLVPRGSSELGYRVPVGRYGKKTDGRDGKTDMTVAARPGHSVYVDGGSGAGKTASIYVPTINGWQGAVFASTSRRNVDLIKETIAAREAKGGPVKIYDPTGSIKAMDSRLPTATFNPLKYCKTVEGAREMAKKIFDVGGAKKDTGNDKTYWESSTKGVFATLLLVCARATPQELEAHGVRTPMELLLKFSSAATVDRSGPADILYRREGELKGKFTALATAAVIPPEQIGRYKDTAAKDVIRTEKNLEVVRVQFENDEVPPSDYIAAMVEKAEAAKRFQTYDQLHNKKDIPTKHELKHQAEDAREEALALERQTGIYNEILTSEPEKQQTVATLVRTTTEPWDSKEALKSATSSDTEIDIPDVIAKKGTIYSHVPPHKEEVAPLNALITTTVMTEAITYAINTGTTDKPTLIAIDEFGNNMVPGYAKLSGQMRDIGIVSLISTQNPRQIDKLYGKDDAATIKANHQMHVELGGSDIPTLEDMSKLMGEGIYRTRSTNVGGDTSMTLGQERRSIHTPADIRTLDPFKGIVITPGINPIYTHLEQAPPMMNKAINKEPPAPVIDDKRVAQNKKI